LRVSNFALPIDFDRRPLQHSRTTVPVCDGLSSVDPTSYDQPTYQTRSLYEDTKCARKYGKWGGLG